MVPFYTFYSMFGFQRVGDLIWQAADSRTRGFLLGATAGRTTLLGEGLQHQDGHSLLLASTVPPCRAYDPAFAYEVATIVRHGIHEMYGADPQDVFYYVTLYNENYPMPAMPEGVADDIVRGAYRWSAAPDGALRATLLFSGSAHSAVRTAADELLTRYGVACDVWSVTSYKILREEALEAERWNKLHPTAPKRVSHVQQLLGSGDGPIVATSDFMRIVPEQIARFLSNRTFVPLGTDGFGRSDTREALRRHFEIDAGNVVVATLHALCEQGSVAPTVVADAISHYGIDAEAVNPLHAQ